MSIGVDSLLTAKVKDYALHGLNADLVGVANIERFSGAPLKMSPHGLLPKAKSVVVMALHHPDGIIEMGGMTHPQDMGPYRFQSPGINDRLDELSYRMALHLEDLGYDAVPIISSNIWRYKGYKDLKEHFAPDVSHMHCAVAAGLAEFGYNGLAITPEYGARQRFVTIVTDAELTPTTLIEPGSVCDNCMLCAKHCLSGALTKELDGWNIVKIEDKEYRYVKKNLWRCAWGEHFDLDLDLEIPEKVTEEVILENLVKHGKRGGEMGSCLRYCVPKNLRYFDKDYTNAPRRKKHVNPAEEIATHRRIVEDVRASTSRYGIDHVIFSSKESFAKFGVDIAEFLPDGQTAITMVQHYRKPDKEATDNKNSRPQEMFIKHHMLFEAGFDSLHVLERFGYSTVIAGEYPEEKISAQIKNIMPGREIFTKTFFTSAKLPETGFELPAFAEVTRTSPENLKTDIKVLLENFGIRQTGVAPAERFDGIKESISPIFEGEKVFNAIDKAPPHFKFDPEITLDETPLYLPGDYVKGAKSVIVFALRLPKASVDITARTPAEAVGPLAFAQIESARLLNIAAWNVMRLLEDRGYKATWTLDLMNTGSFTGTPRGPHPDLFANRFAAVAAGLGRLSMCGSVVTPEHGTNVRFAAVITDADISLDETLKDSGLIDKCSSCSNCVSACPTAAFAEPVSARIDGITESFRPIKRVRCDWAKRYSLVGSSGNMYEGWTLDDPAPEEITSEALAASLRKHPESPKHRPCNYESCMLSCPYTRPQD